MELIEYLILTEKKYKVLQNNGYIKNISVQSIKDILKNYGGVISNVDEKIYKKYFRYIKIKNEERYVTYLDFIIDGQRSDLTLICEITFLDNDVLTIIEDLHVL